MSETVETGMKCAVPRCSGEVVIDEWNASTVPDAMVIYGPGGRGQSVLRRNAYCEQCGLKYEPKVVDRRREEYGRVGRSGSRLEGTMLYSPGEDDPADD